MRARVASLLAIDETCVGLKAQTMEGLGPIGAGEAIAAQAVALLAVSAPAPSKRRPRRTGSR